MGEQDLHFMDYNEENRSEVTGVEVEAEGGGLPLTVPVCTNGSMIWPG